MAAIGFILIPDRVMEGSIWCTFNTSVCVCVHVSELNAPYCILVRAAEKKVRMSWCASVCVCVCACM